MIQRKNLILLVAGIVLALLAVLVLAAHGADTLMDTPAIISPLNNTNITGTITLNATFDPQYNQSLVLNVTFHWKNRTGYFVLNTTVHNTTSNQTIFQNLSFDTTLLADGKYNLTVSAVNKTTGTSNSNSSFIINQTNITLTVDNTPPNVTLNFLNLNNVGNASMKFNFSIISNNQTFNASVFDAATNVANVYFWFTNGTGNDFNVSGFNLSGEWFISYNVSTLFDGKQGVYVVANDSVGKINNTFSLNFTVDLNAPNVTVNFLNNDVNGSNYSFSAIASNKTFNASVFDSLTEVGNVYFWFDNGTGQDFNVSGLNTSGVWTVSYNLSALVEQKQGVMVVANDTVSNINNSAAINFTLDFSSPNVSKVTTNGNPNNASNFSFRTNNQTFNFTIFDSLTAVQSVYFWFDNGTGTDFNFTATNQSGEWVVSYNVSALGEGRQGIRVRANDTVGNVNNTALNFTVDFTTPNVSVLTLNARNVQNDSNFSDNRNITFNFTIFDSLTAVQSVYFWFDNGTGNDFNVTAINVSGDWYVSYNVSALQEGQQGVRIRANDSVGNINNSEMNFTVDRTLPGVTPSVSGIGSTSATLTATVNDTGAMNCSFSGSESGSGGLLSGTALLGNGAMSSFSSTLDVEPSSTYSVTVTCRDHAGNSGSGSTSFSTSAASSSSSGGGGSGGSSGGVSTSVQGSFEKKVWTSINAGETASVTLKNGAVGVTEVSLTVPQTVYGAWIQVAKKDSLPSSVSSFSGKVYRNLEISKGPALAKEGAFTDATIKFKVEKAWLTEQQLTKEGVALHHYADGKWSQLATQVGEDDGTYVHYSAKTPGFSYFVIGQKSGAAAPEVEAAPVEAPAEAAAEAPAEAPAMEQKGMSKGLLLALLAAVVVVVAVVLYMRKKR